MTMSPQPFGHADAVINLLPLPVILVGQDGKVSEANAAAEDFLEMSRSMLRRTQIADILPYGSPILSLIDEARRHGGTFNEYRVDIGGPRLGPERIVDVFISPAEAGEVLILLQEKTIAEKIDRQLTHRGAARSISAMGSMLAHEIKNPLSGIRGAAQLLESSVDEDDRALTKLICDEADRIVSLVDRFETFADGKPIPMAPVNIHEVLEHVKRLALSGFARHIRIVETYDPSLPPVFANRDQLVQVFLNLVKNAAEAIGIDQNDGEIELTTAFRPGVRMAIPGSQRRVALPLEFCVKDNGPGVPSDLVRNLFDPFVTTKASGTGLGLALVAKIVGDHGGIIECDSLPRRTIFRILMPMHGVQPGSAEPGMQR
jgi:two-component system, NtrC family, nitrogen regulation sensor histidine kinase GlnL